MRAWLSQANIQLSVRDFFQDPFSEEELRHLLRGQSVAGFFSWVSPSFRKLGLPRRALDEDRMVAMMLEQPRLIRRPLVVVSGNLLPAISGSDRIIGMLQKELGVGGD